MKTVWKYPVMRNCDIAHNIPKGARFVSVGPDPADPEGQACVWAEVDPDCPEPKERFRFSVFGTGGRIPDFKTYVGSFLQPPHIWHVYSERM